MASLLARTITATLLLPGTVAGLVPAALAWLDPWRRPVSPAMLTAEALLATAGLGLLGWTIALFARRGRGTLAPWDAPKRLVVEGPSRWLRNPMYLAVPMILAGEGLMVASPLVGAWLAVGIVGFTIRVRVYEEPALAREFGEEFAQYRRQVNRWFGRSRHRPIPRG